MKKILLVFTLLAGFGIAANAQSTEKATDSAVEPVKVEVAGKVATETTVAEPATVKSTETPAKSCCSSKKGKETASAKSKSCCAEGNKSKANCSDKKEESTITQ